MCAFSCDCSQLPLECKNISFVSFKTNQLHFDRPVSKTLATYFAVVPYVCRYDNRWQSWLIYFCVVIGVNTDFFSAEMKSIATMLDCFQLVVGLEVRKTPKSTIDDVGEALFLRYLQKKLK